MREDFLSQLGLDPSLKHPPADVKKAWRNKCNEHHPDKGGDPEEFVRVTHAYKMLTDPAYRHEEERKVRPEAPDINVRMTIPVTFEEAFFGRTINLCFNRVELGTDFKPIVKEEQELVHVDFTLPRGCFDGHQVKEPGKGLKCGEQVGDLLISVIPQPHFRFKHKGMDIRTSEKVPLDLMLKGGELEVQTMYGLKTLKIPPGTAPGTELIIKKCGVGQFGSHRVVVDPVFPSKDTLKSEAWKGLDINWDITPEQAEDDRMELLFEHLNKNGFNINDVFKRRG